MYQMYMFSLGGAISNLYAVELARQRALPNCKKQGLVGVQRLVMFTSEQVNTEYRRAEGIERVSDGEGSVKSESDTLGVLS